MGTLGTCPGPPDFFLFEGPQLAVVKYLLKKTNYLIVEELVLPTPFLVFLETPLAWLEKHGFFDF